jgi:UDP-N-acetylmuramyl pentapeptide phosphotransferase/UDP-N-acetylglucosamine-1-phosphate transferase
LAVPDLQEQAMLGDTGANVLGAAVGLAAVVALDRGPTVALAVVLLTLNVASEWVSFSAVIDRTGPLRWFDRLGSKR